MLRNDGYILYEDPDIIARGPVPPNETLVIPLNDPEVDGTLYDWVVNVRSEDAKSFVAADPGMFDIQVSADEVRVTLAIHDDFRPHTEMCRSVRVHGHLIGDHTLLKAELRGLTTTIIYDRAPGDTTDFTTLSWILYNWRINGRADLREYVRIPESSYSSVVIPNRVTITLNDSTTSWISTRLLGYTPSTSGGDNKVKVTSNDTTADYLLPKLRAGAGISITEYNDGGYEQVEITNTGAIALEKCGIFLTGPYDGTGRVYVIPEEAQHAPPRPIVKIYHNGRRLNPTEYEVFKSVGTLTGYDRVRILGFRPRPRSKIYSDYYPV